MKKQIYLHEFNMPMEGSIYLPLASGLIRAYAESILEIKAAYEFAPFIFRREPIEQLMEVYDNPAFALFSVAAWNEQYCLEVSKNIGQRWPDCGIVFGGSQIPSGKNKARDYMMAHPWISYAVLGEGEGDIAEILLHHLNPLKEEIGITRKTIALGSIPSPYLAGLYDYLLEEDSGIKYQAIFETNRGCPYHCAFCGWDRGGQQEGIRSFDISRIKAEIDWMGYHGIDYIFCADGNFGILDRDIEIARMICDTKERYGYPEKVRACYAKDAGDRVVKIASILKACDAGKAVTHARQSYSAKVLRLVGRKGQKDKQIQQFREDLNAVNIPTYSELILGLPGETFLSWIDGLERAMSERSQLFIYPAQVYPNAQLSDPAYQALHGIVTRRILLTETHGLPRQEREPEEYEEIIVSTKTLSEDDFRLSLVISWMVMTLHGMGLCRELLNWMADQGEERTNFLGNLFKIAPYISGLNLLFIKNLCAFLSNNADRILSGGGRCLTLPAYGEFYWDVEEAAFLFIQEHREDFYRDIRAVAEWYMLGLELDTNSLAEIIYRDREHIPSLADYQHDRLRYARDVVLHGRKSGRFDD